MTQEETIHHILAKSYLAHFIASLVGLFIDSFINITFDGALVEPVAIFFMGAGPALMLWAQYTSWHCQVHKHSASYFHHGPYQFIRNPTHLGILMLVTGYTLVSGSVVFFGTTLIGFLVSNIFFKKYESMHRKSFGQEYENYQSQTPRI